MQPDSQSKKCGMTRLKKTSLALAAAAASVVILVLLLLYRPARYNRDAAAEQGPRQVSKYLTHQLLPSLYNGVQLAEPFELVVTQEGINDIVASSKWPKQTEGISFLAPVVLLVPGRIVLMGTITAAGAQLVLTAEIAPALDRQGLLNLALTKVAVGAVNITPFAKVLLKKMYLYRLEPQAGRAEQLEALVVRSLLEDRPFEPVFQIEDRYVRIEGLSVEKGRLTMRLAPVL